LKVKVFCLPYAGGSKSAMVPLGRMLSEHLFDVTLVELPGRGSRYKESLLSSIEDMAEDIFFQIQDFLTQPYSLFGHSMGALLAPIVAQKIAKYDFPKPACLFVSGRKAPSMVELTCLSELTDDKLLERIQEWGGVDPNVLSDDGFKEYLIPIMRADFKAVENFKYNSGGYKLNMPIAVFLGNKDSVSISEASAWQLETSHKIIIKQFDGDHFFIFQKAHEMATNMKMIISQIETL
jgi:external thioesterase TEII